MTAPRDLLLVDGLRFAYGEQVAIASVAGLLSWRLWDRRFLMH